MVPFGHPLIDKYAGDALYAVLLYLVIRTLWPAYTTLPRCALAAVLGMICIESFQLTGIPLAMRQSVSSLLKLISIALGTKFSWLDLLAYALGLTAVVMVDRSIEIRREPREIETS